MKGAKKKLYYSNVAMAADQRLSLEWEFSVIIFIIIGIYKNILKKTQFSNQFVHNAHSRELGLFLFIFIFVFLICIYYKTKDITPKGRQNSGLNIIKSEYLKKKKCECVCMCTCVHVCVCELFIFI